MHHSSQRDNLFYLLQNPKTFVFGFYFYTNVFYFRYYKTDENTIRIEFEYENFRYNRDIEVEELFSSEIKALKKYYLDKHNEEVLEREYLKHKKYFETMYHEKDMAISYVLPNE